LNDLVDYRNIHGHCNVPQHCSQHTKLAKWVQTQRCQYRLHSKGKSSPMTTFRIQELESLDFEWDSHGAAWEARLSDLVDYRNIHGHCNVPQNYSENSKLANWVQTQRCQYRLHLRGKSCPMTIFRIQGLESLGFEWDSKCAVTWEARLNELADYRKIHGHCDVPMRYSENTKLADWVTTQRCQYRLHLEGKRSYLTLSRLQALEMIGLNGTALAPRENTD
jgi:hypothetical protein